MKKTADLNRDRCKTITAVMVFDSQKTTLVLSLSDDLKKSLSLKVLLGELKKIFPLKGGGRDDLIQAGAPLTQNEYKDLICRIPELVKTTIGS